MPKLQLTDIQVDFWLSDEPEVIFQTVRELDERGNDGRGAKWEPMEPVIKLAYNPDGSHGMSLREIARELRVSHQAVFSRLTRIKRRVRHEIGYEEAR